MMFLGGKARLKTSSCMNIWKPSERNRLRIRACGLEPVLARAGRASTEAGSEVAELF